MAAAAGRYNAPMLAPQPVMLGPVPVDFILFALRSWLRARRSPSAA
jgi:hypothetical protein